MHQGANNMKKILIIPDSIWGSESGHRSTQFLAEALSSHGLKVGIYSSEEKKSSESNFFLKKNNINFYSKQPYRFYHQSFFNYFALSSFKKVLNEFQPDHVLYFGAINNKVCTEHLIKRKIPYYYLPLTTEYYCLKDFAGLDDGACYKCINGNYFNALRNDCISGKNKYLTFVKKSIERIKSKKRILNADRIIAYSNSQLEVLERFGVDLKKSAKTPIFFNADHLKKVNVSKGDYFVVIGQCSTAKGWHYIPKIIRKTKGIKFKLIIYREETADAYIRQYQIQDLIDSGYVEIVSNLEKHIDVLNVIGKSKAVIVPSIYQTTGEFSLLESIGLSKPVLVFDAGIHKDVFKDRHNAMISEVGNTDKVASDIEELSKNNALWNKLSKGSKVVFNELTNFNNFEQSLQNILIKK